MFCPDLSDGIGIETKDVMGLTLFPMSHSLPAFYPTFRTEQLGRHLCVQNTMIAMIHHVLRDRKSIPSNERDYNTQLFN